MISDKQVKAARRALLEGLTAEDFYVSIGVEGNHAIINGSGPIAHSVRAALEAAEAAAWQPIESAPKDGTAIVVLGPHKNAGHYTSVCAWPENWSGKWPVAYMAYAAGDPTHWRHLPQPPKETT